MWHGAEAAAVAAMKADSAFAGSVGFVARVDSGEMIDSSAPALR